MKTLPYGKSRCSGRYWFSENVAHEPASRCPQRDTCQRYQAFRYWDKEAGISDYRGISVAMAVEDCQHKIEIAAPAV